MTSPARTIFLGSGQFAVPVLATLAGHPAVGLVSVITAPTRVGSRGRPTDPPVATWANDHGIPMLRPIRLRSPESLADIRALEPDLLVLADYGQIVPEALLDLPRHGALNLHPSLLPRHRGATPVQAAIMAGDNVTGVTLMLMDAGLDSGPIIAQRTHRLTGAETGPELEQELARLGAALVGETLGAWLAGQLQPRDQPAEGVIVTRPLRREHGRLDPHLVAEALARQVRAYQPWPGTFFDVNGERLIVWRARNRPAQGGSPGLLTTVDEGVPAVVTTDGLLELVEVQPAGGRRMSGQELVRGRPGLIGTRIDVPSGADQPDSR